MRATPRISRAGPLTVAFIATLLALALLAIPRTAYPTVLAYWPADETSGSVLNDISGRGMHGTLRGPDRVPARCANGIDVLPTSEIVHGIPSSMDDPVTTRMTVSAFVRWHGDHPQTYSPYSYILDARDDDFQHRGFIVFLATGGRVVFQVGTPSGAKQFSSARVVQPDVWTHVAVTMNTAGAVDTVRLYLQGALDTTLTSTALSYQGTSTPISIGNNRWQDGQYAPFNGVLDELRVQDVTLNAAEVANEASTCAPPTFQLATSARGSGTVQRVPDLPAYAVNQVVTLIAQPEYARSLVRWVGPVADRLAPVTTVTMTGDLSVEARFTVALAVSVIDGSGTVAVDPDLPEYAVDTTVVLTPSPPETFSCWGGDASGYAIPLGVAMTRDKSITASFCDAGGVSIDVIGGGTVLRDPDHACFDYGETVTLTAVPDTGWHFVEWTGTMPSPDNPLTFEVWSPQALTAVFAENQYALHASADGPGVIAIAPLQEFYTYGTHVEVSAIPSGGACFGGWSGDVTSFAPVLDVEMTRDYTLVAHFLQFADTLADTVLAMPAMMLVCPAGDAPVALQLVRNPCGLIAGNARVMLSFANCGGVTLAAKPAGATYIYGEGAKTVSQWTDAIGTVSFALAAGGHSTTACADVLGHDRVMATRLVRSPDINGSLVVDPADVALLQQDMLAYNARSDLNADGAVNIADFTILAAHMGHGGAPVVAANEPQAAPATWSLRTIGRDAHGAPSLVLTLAEASAVDVRVYDTAGRCVRTLLHDAVRAAGDHALAWDALDAAGRPAPSGVYAVRAVAGARAVTTHVLIVR